MAEKVFVIGLDGATWNLINPLIERDELPSIERLVQNGVKGPLRSTMIPLSPVAWTSFATGKNPDKHGIFEFSHRKTGSYKSIPYNSTDRKCEALWNTLSREGKKVGIINVPATYPVEKVNGFMISGFPTPEDMEDFTYPKTLLLELRGEFGKEFRFQSRVTMQDEAHFLDEAKITNEYVFKATDYLMNKYPWDFLMTVFTGMDTICHGFWKYFDPNHPLHDPSAPEEYKRAIYDIYKSIDNKVGKLVDNIDSETIVILMSDHGFGPLYYGVSLNNWLLREGYLKLKKSPPTSIRYWMFRKGINQFNLFKLIKKLKITQSVKKRTSSRESKFVKLGNKFLLTRNDIDWSRTRAYSLGSAYQLFINLKGREPQGIVIPNGGYKKLVDEIVTKLQGLKDPNRDNIIFNKVYKKTDVFPSASIQDDAPDIIFFDENMKYSIYRFFEFGSNDLVSLHTVWSGMHVHEGIFVGFYEKQIKRKVYVDNAGICDIAPTVMHILNVPIPSDFDGSVLLDIFEEDSAIRTRETRFYDTEMGRIQEKIRGLRLKDRL